jgi:acetolactate synthase-1/2/3 large subunit
VDVALDQQVAPRVTSKVGADGVLVSRPMEDMWHYLDPEELQALLN